MGSSPAGCTLCGRTELFRGLRANPCSLTLPSLATDLTSRVHNSGQHSGCSLRNRSCCTDCARSSFRSATSEGPARSSSSRVAPRYLSGRRENTIRPDVESVLLFNPWWRPRASTKKRGRAGQYSLGCARRGRNASPIREWRRSSVSTACQRGQRQSRLALEKYGSLRLRNLGICVSDLEAETLALIRSVVLLCPISSGI